MGRSSPEILADLRGRCPVAHTDRFHGAYLVTRYADIADVAHETETFSSRVTTVNDNHPDNIKLELPPITLDPPDHGPIRRALLPAFNPHEVAALEPYVVDVVNRLVDDLAGRELVDGALDYSQLVPVEIMGHLFGVSPDMGPQFRAWVDGLLKEGQVDIEIGRKVNREIQAFFANQLQLRRENPAENLVTMVLNAEARLEDGTTRPFSERERIGALYVLMLGGIDTTWSSLGASLFHLGTHPADLATLVERPELIPSAIEEFLRFYSPVTIARVITEDAEVAGCPVEAGQRLLLSFPSANRDRHRLRPARRGRARPGAQPPPRLRCRRAPLPWLQPRPDGAAGGATGVACPVPPLRTGRGPRRDQLVGRPRARPQKRSPAHPLRSRQRDGQYCRPWTGNIAMRIGSCLSKRPRRWFVPWTGSWSACPSRRRGLPRSAHAPT